MAVTYRMNTLYCLLLWIWRISITEHYRNDGSTEDIVATDIGVKIEKRGQLVSVLEYNIISLIIKLPNLTSIDHLDSIALSRIDTCYDIDRDFKRNYKRLVQVTSEETQKYVSSRFEILQAFVTPTFSKNGNSTRQKRGLLSFLGGSIISMAIGGITEYQIHKINQHVSENIKAINSIMQALNREQAVIKSINKQVVGFVNDITENLTRFLYE